MDLWCPFWCVCVAEVNAMGRGSLCPGSAFRGTSLGEKAGVCVRLGRGHALIRGTLQGQMLYTWVELGPEGQDVRPAMPQSASTADRSRFMSSCPSHQPVATAHAPLPSCPRACACASFPLPVGPDPTGRLGFPGWSGELGKELRASEGRRG